MHYKIIELSRNDEGLVPYDVFEGENKLTEGADSDTARNTVEKYLHTGDTVEEVYQGGRVANFTYEVFVAQQEMVRKWLASH